jgi:anti-sigma B factor antagonist
MKLSHEDYDHLTVLALHGDFTADDVDAFRQGVGERMGRQVRDFVLDVREVEFIDSRGLETLLWLQEQCGEKLGQVRLAGATPNLEKILQVTRLAPRFDRHPGVDAAIKSLRI